MTLTVLEKAEVASGERSAPWHVLWTRSHCEQLVYNQLARRGFDLFLPAVSVWSRQNGSRHVISVPLFPGYVFLNHSIDKASYLEICKVRGLVCLLGPRWDHLDVIPGGEIDAIRRVVQAGCEVQPHPYLRVGQRVRIARGPLADVEGILLRAKPKKGLLVLSVTLLQRAVAVEVDCTQVVAA